MPPDVCIQNKLPGLVRQVCYPVVEMLVITQLGVVISHIIYALSCCLTLDSKIAQASIEETEKNFLCF